MSDQIRGVRNTPVAQVTYLASVQSSGDRRIANAGNQRVATAYGAPVGAASSKVLDVKSAASQYQNFTDALLPMVLATGAKGTSAVHIVNAIRNNPDLRAQAERAYMQSQMKAV